MNISARTVTELFGNTPLGARFEQRALQRQRVSELSGELLDYVIAGAPKYRQDADKILSTTMWDLSTGRHAKSDRFDGSIRGLFRGGIPIFDSLGQNDTLPSIEIEGELDGSRIYYRGKASLMRASDLETVIGHLSVVTEACLPLIQDRVVVGRHVNGVPQDAPLTQLASSV